MVNIVNSLVRWYLIAHGSTYCSLFTFRCFLPFVAFYLLLFFSFCCLFCRYGDEKTGTLDAPQLRRFCMAEQGQEVSEQQAVQLIQESELSIAKSKNMLTLDGGRLFWIDMLFIIKNMFLLQRVANVFN